MQLAKRCSGGTIYARFFSCDSEELYEIGGDINYEVGSKILSGSFDCGKLPSDALRVKHP